MPTYEYLCTSCENRFDIWQSINDDPLTTCDRCGGRLRKVFHPAGIVFKGSGFYSTDSRRASKQASQKKESAGASGDSSEKKAASGGDKGDGGSKSESATKTDSKESKEGKSA